MSSASPPLTLAALNAMERDAFVAALGPTFENAPWVASSAWAAGPFASVAALHAAMLNVVRQAPDDKKLAFLCGHPELAGREAQAGTMTMESVGEQKSAGLNALTSSDEATPSQIISDKSWPSAGECITPWPEDPFARNRFSHQGATPRIA